MSEKVLVDRELLNDLVSSLEGEVESRYSNGIKDHPAMRRDYECDIEPVIRGKELLAAPAAPAVQAEPVAVAITEKQVMTAYFSASRLHISGTSNWVAAFAQSLNKQIAAPPAIPAQPDASVLSILRDVRESVRYHKGMQNLGHEAGKQHAAELAALIERIDAALAGKGGAQ